MASWTPWTSALAWAERLTEWALWKVHDEPIESGGQPTGELHVDDQVHVVVLLAYAIQRQAHGRQLYTIDTADIEPDTYNPITLASIGEEVELDELAHLLIRSTTIGPHREQTGYREWLNLVELSDTDHWSAVVEQARRVIVRHSEDFAPYATLDERRDDLRDLAQRTANRKVIIGAKALGSDHF